MMEKKSVWTVLLFLLLSMVCYGQAVKESQIEPIRVSITHSKTTNLIFPYGIVSVDRGTKDVLVQKVAGVENVLQIKAGKPAFEETNLTVVTTDGSLYSCVIAYSKEPGQINIKLDQVQAHLRPMAIFSNNSTNDLIGQSAQLVASRLPSIKGIKAKGNGMTLAVKGIFIESDVLYLQVYLKNVGTIPYDVGQFRLFMVDRKKSARTASQEVEIIPLHVSGNNRRIGAYSEQCVTIAISKLTIPDGKQIDLQMMESNGGRHLKLSMHNKSLSGAQRMQP